MKRAASPEDGPDRAQATVTVASPGDDRFSPPSVAIVIELECRPRLVWNARTDGQLHRLLDYIHANDQLEEIVGRAVLQSRDFLNRVLDEDVE